MAAPLQFWFDFASTYSYVAALRIAERCASASVPLEHRPFLLGPLFTEQLGIRDSPFNVQPLRGRYMWRDLERLCQKHALPWRRPTAFPRSSVLAARVAWAGDGKPWGPAFVEAAFRANFADDRELDEATLAPILTGLGQDAAAVLARAVSPEVRALLRASTDQARSLGFFGAPDFLVAGEHFFGQDRLDDAIDWAIRAR